MKTKPLKTLLFSKPVYYGWIVAVLLAFMNFTTSALLTVNLGLFIWPMSESLGISQSWFGWAHASRLIGAAIGGIMVGKLLDVKNAGIPLMVVSVFVLSLFLFLSSITFAWQILIVCLLSGMLGLAPSSGNLFTVVPLSRWFVKKRGKAMAIAFFGFPAGVFILLPFTQYLITWIGWRSSFKVFAISGSIILFIVALFLRRSPEDDELCPDGIGPGAPETDMAEPDQIPTPIELIEISWTRNEAMHTAAFWKLTVATAFIVFALATLAVFRIPYFVSLGIDPLIVSYAFSMESVVSMVISFLLGPIIARIKVNYLMGLSALFLFFHVLTAIFASQIWHMFLAQIFIGIFMQSRFVFEGVMWPTYFGKKHIGNIRGLTVPLCLTFSFLGGPFAGLMYDIFGSYVPGWCVVCVLLMVSVVLFAATPKPNRPNGLPSEA